MVIKIILQLLLQCSGHLKKPFRSIRTKYVTSLGMSKLDVSVASGFRSILFFLYILPSQNAVYEQSDNFMPLLQAVVRLYTGKNRWNRKLNPRQLQDSLAMFYLFSGRKQPLEVNLYAD